MRLRPIPALADNYIWMLDDGQRALIVDPGEAAPVQAVLAADGLVLDTILVTHHHHDHTGAIAELADAKVRVIGPAAERQKIGSLSETVADGDAVQALGIEFRVLAVPGHTLGHITYHAPALQAQGLIFCGDTLFSAGCGRLFEGTPEQMHASLSKLRALPDATAVCCTHEYTLSNLAFAQAVEPDNADIAEHIAAVKALRAEGKPSLPSSIALEKRINPYLRCMEGTPIASARAQGAESTAPVAVFAALRRWKDGFRAPAGV